MIDNLVPGMHVATKLGAMRRRVIVVGVYRSGIEVRLPGESMSLPTFRHPAAIYPIGATSRIDGTPEYPSTEQSRAALAVALDNTL